MDNVQIISGADAVPTGFTVQSEVVNEPRNSSEEERIQQTRIPEENKGAYIDTYA